MLARPGNRHGLRRATSPLIVQSIGGANIPAHMGDVMDDERIWLTYDDAAAMLDVKPDSVRRRAAARRWPRRPGNDRKVRVGIPRDAIPSTPQEKSGDDDAGDSTPVIIPNESGLISVELSEAKSSIARLEAINDGLKQQVEDLREDRDRWYQEATRPRPTWFDRIRSSFTRSGRE